MALPANEVFATIFGNLTGIDPKKETWVNDLYTVAKTYIDNGTFTSNDPMLFDVILSDQNAPKAFQDRFKAITDLRNKNATFVPTIAQYTQMEKQYKQVLSAVGLNDLATNNQIANFISNEVSADEMSSRITKAFTAIDSADELTKGVLSERFPGLTRQDVARGLLLGPDSAYEITKKIQGAQVVAEAKRAGLGTSALAETELAAQNLSTADLRKGFGAVAEQKTGIQQAARIFGQPTDAQKTLEQEQLVGDAQAAQKLKGLRSQARAEFAGQTGIQTGSLSRKKTTSQL